MFSKYLDYVWFMKVRKPKTKKNDSFTPIGSGWLDPIFQAGTSGQSSTRLQRTSCRVNLFIFFWSWSTGCFDMEGRKGGREEDPQSIVVEIWSIWVACMAPLLYFCTRQIIFSATLKSFSNRIWQLGVVGASDSSLMGCTGKVVWIQDFEYSKLPSFGLFANLAAEFLKNRRL